MRVYGALMWSLGKVLNTPEVVRVYIGCGPLLDIILLVCHFYLLAYIDICGHIIWPYPMLSGLWPYPMLSGF